MPQIPSGLTFKKVATLGTSIVTIALTFHLTLHLPLPTHPTQIPFPILIYGGSAATSTLEIQYAKLSLHPKLPRPHIHR